MIAVVSTSELGRSMGEERDVLCVISALTLTSMLKDAVSGLQCTCVPGGRKVRLSLLPAVRHFSLNTRSESLLRSGGNAEAVFRLQFAAMTLAATLQCMKSSLSK